jgi:hypothetical protein
MNHENLITKDSKMAEESSLFDRVVQILEQTRANVVRAVNSSMVTAYWLIGREIVLELQGGDERAEYGKQVIEKLSRQLTQRYGSGYSATNLKYFRSFYLAYPNRLTQIGRPMGAEFADDELKSPHKIYPADSEFEQSFSPQLSWSHYRALMRIAKLDARDFYERETIECGWDKRSLERRLIEAHLTEQGQLDLSDGNGNINAE